MLYWIWRLCEIRLLKIAVTAIVPVVCSALVFHTSPADNAGSVTVAARRTTLRREPHGTSTRQGKPAEPAEQQPHRVRWRHGRRLDREHPLARKLRRIPNESRCE